MITVKVLSIKNGKDEHEHISRILLLVIIVYASVAGRHWNFASPNFRIARIVGSSATAWNSVGKYFSVIWYRVHVIRQLERDKTVEQKTLSAKGMRGENKKNLNTKHKLKPNCSVLYRISFLTLAISYRVILNRWIPVSFWFCFQNAICTCESFVAKLHGEILWSENFSFCVIYGKIGFN